MEFKVENGDGIDSWKEVTLVYSAALRQMETKMQILNDEFQHVHQYNPIEHIKARIKTPESIVKKLKRYGQESTIDNMVKYINDIAGIRIICSFTSDIYRIADMIRDQRDIKVIAVKDYLSQGQRLQKLSHDRKHTCIFVGSYSGYEGRSTDPYSSHGFLGQPGA